MREYLLECKEKTEDSYSNELRSNIVEDNLNQYEKTTGTSENEYPLTCLSVSHIVNNFNQEFGNIKNPLVKELFSKLLKSFQDNLIYYKLISEETTHLPQIHITIMEDNSIFIEWIFFDFRIGFSIEEEISKSSWYLVSNKNFDNLSKSGFFDEKNIDRIVADLFNCN